MPEQDKIDKIDQDKIDKVDLQVLLDIETHGWSDMSIFPVEGDEEGQPFNYTVGLTKTFRHPELILVGMNLEQGHAVLHSAVEALRREAEYHPNTYSQAVLKDYEVAFVKVYDPFHNAMPMSMTHRFFGDVDCLQLVWPDQNHRFPWHDDFEPMLREHQPLLGVWRGET